MNRTRLEQTLASTRHVREYYSSDRCPPTLLDALKAFELDIDAASWPDRMRSGGVYVNGIRSTADMPLSPPVRVEYFAPRQGSAVSWNAFKREYVLYEDDDLLAVFKPAGLPSMPTRDQQGENLRTHLHNYLGHPVHMPSRLDTSACGIVLTSKHPRSHRAVQHAFEYGAIEKLYLLRCRGPISWEQNVLETTIGRSREHPILRAVGGEHGKRAYTEFLVLRNGLQAFVRAHPRTGRTHQLRVHTSHLGHPIDGDNFYDGAEGDSLCLLAYELRFTHPRTQEKLRLQVPDPLLPPWLPVPIAHAARAR